MSFRIDRNSFHPLGELSAHSAAGAKRPSASSQNFDQVQFSDRLRGAEGRIRQLTAQISQQIRTRPTRSELEQLQAQLQEGSYYPNPGEIAARMLLEE